VSNEKIPTNREAVILDILINGERPGRDIRNEYEGRTGRKIPLGSLYTTLTRMEASGFVTSRTGGTTPERRGYPRKFFSITGTGERALSNYQIFVVNAFGGTLRNV
jgi:DNA-binding PadR family transcriptional regulator